MSLAGAGAGAAAGLDSYLAQLLQQQQGSREDRSLDETIRKNKADEDYKTRALADNNKTRLSIAQQATQDREAAQKDKEGTNLGKGLDELGDNSIVSPQTRSRALNLQAVPPERFKDYVPPSMGKSDPTQPAGQEEVGATPGGFPIVGSNASKLAVMRTEDARAAREAAGKTMTDGNYDLPGVGPIVAQKNKQGRLMYQGNDVTDRVKPHDAPQQPILLQGTGEVPSLVNRRSGVATPIKGTDGNPLGARKTTGQIDREDSGRKATGTLDMLDKAIDGAANQLGPAAGRMSDFEQWVGSGDPALQRVGTLMLVAKMQVDASIGGMRAAASPQLLARWDNLMANKVSPAGLKEAVSVLRAIAGQNGPQPHASVGGDDEDAALLQRLNSRRQSQK